MNEAKSLLNEPIDVTIGKHIIKVIPPVLRWYLEALEIIGSELAKPVEVKKGLFKSETITFAAAYEHFKKPSLKLMAHIAKTTDRSSDWFIDNMTLLQIATFADAFLGVIDIEEVKKVFTMAMQRVNPK